MTWTTYQRVLVHDAMQLSPLVRSQSSKVTLYAEIRKGRRPSFIRAALPEKAEPLVQRFTEHLDSHGIPVEHGQFGAYMQVALVNEGPVTLWIEREPGS